MGDFPYMEWMSRCYLETGNIAGGWSSYLKAHGLANYCVALDPTDVRHQLVYDIENSWYKGEHPLTYSQHRDLTERHKHFVKIYRNKMEEEFDDLKDNESLLRADDIFSESNMSLLRDFSTDVFQVSKMCSDGYIEVCREIFQSSIDNLEAVGLVAPCHFTIIVFGSVAKGDATPYSDLEYAFIVESEDEYFTSLAVESYFRIGNLCESSLGAFDIAELKHSSPPLTGLPTTGFRIDGIKPKAGNIPTGRVGGQKLVLTVDGFMELYKTSAMAPFDGVAGDLSDRLSSSIEIYSSQGDSSVLYELLHQQIMEYERSVTKPASVNRKRLHSFLHDIEHFHYLPEQSMTRTASGADILVKAHIFRYPTLFASNLRLCISLDWSYPWDTFDILESLGFVSQQNCWYLKIVLALSLYIRNKTYMLAKSQSAMVLLKAAITHDDSMYHVPKALTVTLGCLLLPIKHSIRSKLRDCFNLINQGADLNHIMGLLTKNIKVDETDFMLKVELCYFIEDITGALRALEQGIGSINDSVDFRTVLAIIREKYQMTKSDEVERKYLGLICIVLVANNKSAEALDFISWRITYSTSLMDITHWQIMIAQCLSKLDRPKRAKGMCQRVLQECKQELGLEPDDDLLQYLKRKMGTWSISKREHITNIYRRVIAAHTIIGQSYLQGEMLNFVEAAQSLTYALSLCHLMLCVYTMSTDQLRELSAVELNSVDWRKTVVHAGEHPATVRYFLGLMVDIQEILDTA